ncbi:MAG: SDR family NAD(P)-dependent oxidoreductase [Paracoccaceae bacterium]
MILPKMPSFNLEGKRALVTGASSGIGVGCACALASRGAEVTLAARSLPKLTQLHEEMNSEGWSSQVLHLDIADPNQISEKILNDRAFDILVNSAGMGRHSNALDTTVEDFDAVMNVNLRGAYFITQAVAKNLVKEKKAGSLINISSQMAHVGGIDRSVYCASKFAVEGFTKAMALELGSQKIRVNTICPTFILTPMTQPTFDDPKKRDWINSKIKLDRVGEVEDIMGAVLYLASDASSLVTGSSLLVDGGWTAD